ncbi:hypothetical protein C8F01DRAFT_667195 [Mycena amicta]|nr:hypothetical protein C8F01DRAFT_667195 [Mycena amicta]
MHPFGQVIMVSTRGSAGSRARSPSRMHRCKTTTGYRTPFTARRYSTSAELSHRRRPSFDRRIKCSRLLSPLSITSHSNHHLPNTMSSYIRSVVPPSAFGEPRVRAANRRRSSSLSDIVDSLATRVGLKAKTPPSPLRRHVPTSPLKSILKSRSTLTSPSMLKSLRSPFPKTTFLRTPSPPSIRIQNAAPNSSSAGRGASFAFPYSLLHRSPFPSSSFTRAIMTCMGRTTTT